MFRTTMVNLSRDAGSASADIGRYTLGELRADQLIALLEQFQKIDPVENLRGDPEIILETRRFKFLVRTIQNKLCLHDPKRIEDPALVLGPAEIVAELDGSAAAARTAAHPPSRLDSGPVAPAPPAFAADAAGNRDGSEELLRPLHRIALAAVALACSVFLAWPLLSAAPRDPAAPRFEALADPVEIERLSRRLEGVYVTGQDPGHHGIALAATGTVKLFELNANEVPSFVQGTFRVGRVADAVALLGNLSPEIIRQTGKNTLVFCGETYTKIE